MSELDLYHTELLLFINISHLHHTPFFGHTKAYFIHQTTLSHVVVCAKTKISLPPKDNWDCFALLRVNHYGQ